MAGSGATVLSFFIVLVITSIFLVVMLEVFAAKLKTIKVEFNWSMKITSPSHQKTTCECPNGEPEVPFTHMPGCQDTK